MAFNQDFDRNRLKKPQTACYTAQESKDRHNVSPLVALLRCFEQIQHEMILGLRMERYVESRQFK